MWTGWEFPTWPEPMHCGSHLCLPVVYLLMPAQAGVWMDAGLAPTQVHVIISLV